MKTKGPAKFSGFYDVGHRRLTKDWLLNGISTVSECENELPLTPSGEGDAEDVPGFASFLKLALHALHQMRYLSHGMILMTKISKYSGNMILDELLELVPVTA